MKQRTAIKIAIECIDYKSKLYYFDASLYRRGMTDYIYGERCHKHLKRLEDAKALCVASQDET